MAKDLYGEVHFMHSLRRKAVVGNPQNQYLSWGWKRTIQTKDIHHLHRDCRSGVSDHRQVLGSGSNYQRKRRVMHSLYDKAAFFLFFSFSDLK